MRVPVLVVDDIRQWDWEKIYAVSLSLFFLFFIKKPLKATRELT